jgi:hypothetical protein
MRARTFLTSAARAGGVLLFVAAVAACGSAGGSDGVASLGGGKSSSKSTATKAKKDPEEAARAFAQCMREHGIDLPDPQVSNNGKGGVGFTIQAPVGGADSGPPGSSDEFKAANKACQKHLKGVVNGGKRPSAADQEKFKQAALDFAKCMRKHGFDFPDPQFSGDGMVQQLGPSDQIDPNDPKFKSASEACQKQAGLPKPGSGGGLVTKAAA